MPRRESLEPFMNSGAEGRRQILILPWEMKLRPKFRKSEDSSPTKYYYKPKALTSSEMEDSNGKTQISTPWQEHELRNTAPKSAQIISTEEKPESFHLERPKGRDIFIRTRDFKHTGRSRSCLLQILAVNERDLNQISHFRRTVAKKRENGQ